MFEEIDHGMDDTVKTVSELTREIKGLLEVSFSTVRVSGEISNCQKARSGHVYLTLKDKDAQLSGVIWRSAAGRLKFDLEDGLEVVAQGSIDVYPPHGKYQLNIQRITPQGVGALELAFQQLREKLANEGLFDASRKQPLPRFPRRIALVTSPTSAAVKDMLQVISRRWPAADLVVLPVTVQGETAAAQIAEALELVSRLPRVDTVICGRGGGSLEDLWAFNEEIVVRAIAGCPIPVVSAVGHEIDVSLSDLVADVRALTPSEAGELVVPDRGELMAELESIRQRLVGGLRRRADRAKMVLKALAERPVLARPYSRLHELSGRVDELQARIDRAVHGQTDRVGQRLSTLAAALQALSPLEVLGRGYSMTLSEDGGIIRSTGQLAEGDKLVSVLAEGRVLSRVEEIDAGQSD